MIFTIPRGKITYVGTTDTDYTGNKENPRTNSEDVQYLLNGVNSMFPEIHLKMEDVTSSWAGLRPLIHEDGKSASELSRKDEIFHSDTGLISIAGGKLTGYRKMAERAVDEVAKRFQKDGKNLAKCTTDKIVLKGGEFEGKPENVQALEAKLAQQLGEMGLEAYHAHYLVHNYGTQARDIVDQLRNQAESSELALIKAELDFGLEHEMINRAQDFFTRRTGRLYFDIDSIRNHTEALLSYMAKQLDWSPERLAEEKADLAQAVFEASDFPVGNHVLDPEVAKVH
ncbi:MAG: FAD-dependent oxidoreductase [Bacteroidota bacterium]